jgi:hypothetical protein
MIGKLLLAVGGVAVLAAAGVLVAASRQPDVFRVERSARIAAPAERVYPLINDLRQMNGWNPFVRKDPAIQGSYRGPGAGPGAGYDFRGNREVGSGSLQIVEAAAPGLVRMKLDMNAPMEAHNDILFRLVPDGAGTRVTWSMEGPCPLMGKVMGLIFDMDTMVGGAFEQGLADLKLRAEALPQPAPNPA